jgi:hypothetical protein
MQGLVTGGSVEEKFYFLSKWNKFGVTHVNSFFSNYLAIFFQLCDKTCFYFLRHSEVLLLLHVSRIDDLLQFQGRLVLNYERPECLLLVTPKQFNQVVFLLSPEARQLELSEVFNLAKSVDEVVKLNVKLKPIWLVRFA